MEQPINIVKEENDSLEWGTPSKGGARKVYGNMKDDPEAFGKKIERMNLASRYALGEMPYEKYLEELKGLE